ncbi:MAG: triphosphoribosyl-dephospho-CoA synthase CitG [Sedimentibacter sp.]|uniref:triphosphoribosyl-dephospho-CoA synthase CitG n=1 Tax=Sedimentibacter sp. TaxID=1960295 RepID=UPI0029822404|nr:triphosphoribosyl-dephospho-CoA synthase CitG [Sedimentibacter sp.]MDW5300114.1 triphosphoribosyl-dephospho-CoA synthase CitG [Sedimentibacter sp.]
MHSIDLPEILGSNHVSLTEMLDARENRVFEQQKILTAYNLPVISFTLNIPGSIKTFPLAEKSFKEGRNLIIRQLERHNCNIVYQKERIEKTGYESFFAVDFNPYSLKKLMVEIENSNPMGRTFDIDVLKTNGDKISRQDINCKNRTCLICREQAHVCARSKKHPIEEVLHETVEIMSDYFNQKFANMCSSCACRALLYEVCTTPKPGLVDRANNGSHNDMDIYTFIDSSSVLTPYFRDFVLTGIQYYQDEPQQLFERIRYLGVLAEDDMLAATGNVNTHKGLIFSLGVICAATGYFFAKEIKLDIDSILELCKKMTCEVIKNDFSEVNLINLKTNGEKLFAQYGITGIRGEVASGFSSIRNYGLPVLKSLIKQGFSLNDAGALTLLNLIANVKDTNIISRSDIKTQVHVQCEIKTLIETQKIENVHMDVLREIDKQFIDLNISPGGCADLLAITFMLYFIENKVNS